MEDALFCIAQKAFIEKEGKVLALKDPDGKLDFPGGKIQVGEAKNGDASSLAKSLKREVAEEIGLEIEVGDPFSVWYHEFPEGHRNYPKVVYAVAFKCKYLSGEIQSSDEYENFQWVGAQDFQDFNKSSNYFNVLEKYFSKK